MCSEPTTGGDRGPAATLQGQLLVRDRTTYPSRAAFLTRSTFLAGWMIGMGVPSWENGVWPQSVLPLLSEMSTSLSCPWTGQIHCSAWDCLVVGCLSYGPAAGSCVLLVPPFSFFLTRFWEGQLPVTWLTCGRPEAWARRKRSDIPVCSTGSLVLGWWAECAAVNCLSWFAWKLLCWPISRKVIKSGLKSQVFLLAFWVSQFKELAGACPKSTAFSTVCNTCVCVCMRARAWCTQACQHRQVL